MRPSEIIRAMFKPTGPRREEAGKVAAERTTALRANRISVLKNTIAVKDLIDKTLARAERTHGFDTTHS